MKVTRNTPDQLIVENNPIWLALFLTAFALVFIGIGFANLTTQPGMAAIFIIGGLVFAVVFNMAFVRNHHFGVTA